MNSDTGKYFFGWSVCEVVHGDGCKGSEKSDVQQLYLFADSFTGLVSG